MSIADDPRLPKCQECGDAIGWAQVSRRSVPISRVRVLQLSKGLPGPRPDHYFDIPIVTSVNAGRNELAFVDGQEMMVRHEDICGRKQRRRQ